MRWLSQRTQTIRPRTSAVTASAYTTTGGLLVRPEAYQTAG
jgi:hypothetical protein